MSRSCHICFILTFHFDLFLRIRYPSFLGSALFWYQFVVLGSVYTVFRLRSCSQPARKLLGGSISHSFVVLILLSTPAALVAVVAAVACSLAPSARFIIPQKLSHSVKSVPRSQRMSTRPGPQTILTASATGSSSSLELDSPSASSPRASFSPFCCCWNFLFRLAERD